MDRHDDERVFLHVVWDIAWARYAEEIWECGRSDRDRLLGKRGARFAAEITAEAAAQMWVRNPGLLFRRVKLP